MSTNTKRRDLLKVAPLCAVAVALPATASAVSDRTAWEKAMRAYLAAKSEDAAFLAEWRITSDRCKAACERVPHEAFPSDPYTGTPGPITTDNASFVRRARRTVADLASGRMHFDDRPDLRAHRKLCQDVAAAADRRDEQVRRVRSSFAMDEADDMAEELCDRVCATHSALMAMPAPDLAALHWKLDQLRDQDGDMESWAARYVAQTFADIARLLPAAA
ncbi:hypothetical protein GRI38_04270 [Altererythrobacter aurantiacus]|uniref:Tat (Twin-arginine translocation) pathway signal sequence n=1 Tax=Parapontixanthobacter aurantiacus TaxID=1463599 RepID=A0A844ZBS1_9SPHN|nr:hypothetical protein [Parapontixanthobacter aurantiacus]MXO85238.1 hypothetical protein [Parapontixanthobacter aurantiacus]